MQKTNKLKIVFYINLLIAIGLVAYKGYLNFFERDFEAVNARNIQAIRDAVGGREKFSFAVVGNIKNSIGIFERKIVPMLNDAGVDFVVSAGNAVSGGGEDKYRAVHRTFKRLDPPHLLTFGPDEYSSFGAFRFYQHYGPYFFSFDLNGNRFVFLDTTEETPRLWQTLWLRDQLASAPTRNTFLFMSHPLYETGKKPLFEIEESHLQAGPFRDTLRELIGRHEVDAVFSANLPFYSRQTFDGTDYFVTGGAGGLVLNDADNFYHYIKVAVDGDRVDYDLQRLDIGQHGLLRFLESLWFFIHSLFYVGFVNFILILSIFIVVGIKLYTAIFVDRDFYRDFDTDPRPFLDKPLRIAMFTNNYLPFIGGVPLSINRLYRGLKTLGDRVLIFAPGYGRQDKSEEEGVIRVPTLIAFGKRKLLRITNIFSPKLFFRLREFQPDIVHLHHPLWLGSAGLWLARRLKIPTVYTYHTRLEHYAHFVPLPGPLFRNLISHQLVKRFANRCDAVVVPTFSAEEYLRVIGVTAPIHVLPTGIDFERFRQVDDNRLNRLRTEHHLDGVPVLISISRLSQEKNIDFIIDSLAELRHRQYRLLIIGEGNERARLEEKIKRLGLDNHITLVGEVAPEDIPAYCRLGDLFLFASKSETQGMVILEAMAAGMPVVAVRSSGIDDVVRDGVNGFKTPEDPGAWIGRLEALLDDPALRRRFSDNAVESARQHSVAHFAADMRNIYARLLAAQARSADKDSRTQNSRETAAPMRFRNSGK
jgi:glycosyltransferase involved in cell wall biosynthesis